jgi:hypothetical protein
MIGLQDVLRQVVERIMDRFPSMVWRVVSLGFSGGLSQYVLQKLNVDGEVTKAYGKVALENKIERQIGEQVAPYFAYCLSFGVVVGVASALVLVLYLWRHQWRGYLPAFEVPRLRNRSAWAFALLIVILLLGFAIISWHWAGVRRLPDWQHLNGLAIRYILRNVTQAALLTIGLGWLIYAGIVLTFAPRSVVVIAAPPLFPGLFRASLKS